MQHGEKITLEKGKQWHSFNTASGKYCCNRRGMLRLSRFQYRKVSIPQAVSTVATAEAFAAAAFSAVSIPQAVSTVATLLYLVNLDQIDL